MKGKRKPDYGKLVDLLTKAAIKNDNPFFACFISCNFIFYFTNWGNEAALSSLGAMLLGVIVTGLFVAVSMTAGRSLG